VRQVAGRRERNKAEKWDRILHAATKLFRERGFERTTTVEIARAAGIGTGTLFLYAPTKEHLLVAVFREEVGRAWDDAFDGVDPERPLLDQLCQAFFAVIDYHERDPRLGRAFLREVPTVSDAAREGVRDFMRSFLNRLDSFFATAQQQGRLARDVSTSALATSVYALFSFHIQRRFFGHTDVTQCQANLGAAFELQLRGLVPDRER
jgi:AcrR family transcriptional regulator